MVDLPLQFPLFAPSWLASGPTVLRSWAGEYRAPYQFTRRVGADWRGIPEYHNNPVQDAFRHNFVGSALYLDKYKSLIDGGVDPARADREATNYVLWLGNLNEMHAPNPLRNHLKDYWNNFESINTARFIAKNLGPNISNSELADYIAYQIEASRSAPPGVGNIVIDTLDPRLSPSNYDVQRLPDRSWNPHSHLFSLESMVPSPIMRAFPRKYGLP